MLNWDSRNGLEWGLKNVIPVDLDLERNLPISSVVKLPQQFGTEGMQFFRQRFRFVFGAGRRFGLLWLVRFDSASRIGKLGGSVSVVDEVGASRARFSFFPPVRKRRLRWNGRRLLDSVEPWVVPRRLASVAVQPVHLAMRCCLAFESAWEWRSVQRIPADVIGAYWLTSPWLAHCHSLSNASHWNRRWGRRTARISRIAGLSRFDFDQ